MTFHFGHSQKTRADWLEVFPPLHHREKVSVFPLEKAGLKKASLQIHLRLLMQAPVWDQAGVVFEGGRVCV